MNIFRDALEFAERLRFGEDYEQVKEFSKHNNLSMDEIFNTFWRVHVKDKLVAIIHPQDLEELEDYL